jgi:hypothetical protein
MGNNPALSAQGGFDNINVVFPGADVIAAAATITPKRLLTRITGTVPIATITPPNNYFNGPLYLYTSSASVFTTVTTGNIAVAVTATVNKAMAMIYDPSISKWQPLF